MAQSWHCPKRLSVHFPFPDKETWEITRVRKSEMSQDKEHSHCLCRTSTWGQRVTGFVGRPSSSCSLWSPFCGCSPWCNIGLPVPKQATHLSNHHVSFWMWIKSTQALQTAVLLLLISGCTSVFPWAGSHPLEATSNKSWRGPKLCCDLQVFESFVHLFYLVVCLPLTCRISLSLVIIILGYICCKYLFWVVVLSFHLTHMLC